MYGKNIFVQGSECSSKKRDSKDDKQKNTRKAGSGFILQWNIHNNFYQFPWNIQRLCGIIWFNLVFHFAKL